MTLHQLMARLAERDVRVSVADGDLKITAAKGALTDELRQALKQLKPEVVALLQGSATAGLPQGHEVYQPRPEDRFLPFPFADLQVAFYMADNPYLEFHVRPHYYCETDCDGLDVERYVAAVNKALQRHRGELAMVTDDGQLRLLPEVPLLRCPINDWRALSEAEAVRRLDELRVRGMRQQLPLDRWPWFDLQISLWREDGRERARIHSNQNNFYTDGYGVTLLQRDIDRFYEQPDAQLPELEFTFRDAVLALQALAHTPAGERARRYWLDRLPGLPGPPDLPQTSLNRRCRSRLQRRQGYLSASQWTQFKAHAARCGLTPTGAITAAYAEVLSAWSGSRHFILSNMVTRRLPVHPQVMEIIGNFASLYPLEVDLRGDGSFADRALRVQQQMMRDASHREWGGMQVMQAFNRMRGEFGSVPCPFVIGSGLFMEKYKKADFSCLETSQTMLDHQFWELDDGRYFYVWDLLEEFFPPRLIDAMWHAFAQLLERLASDADCWQQACFDLAPAAEPSAIAFDAPADASDDRLLHGGLSVAASQRPEKVAVWSPQGAVRYGELDRWSQAVAAQLMARGVCANELVAVVMDRGPAIVAAATGILRAGAAYVPVDPSLPAERLRYMLDNSRARVVLTSAEHRARIAWPEQVQVLVVPSPAHDAGLAAVPTPVTSPTDLAYVIYTSGSTGRPKGVMIDHRGALNTVVDINRRFGIGAGDVVFGASSFSFDLSVYDVFGVLEAGATLVYPDPGAALNPGHWLDLLIDRQVTVWNSAPPLMGLLVETALRRGQTLPALRTVMLSGDWIPVDLPTQIRKIAPHARVISLGGATEASIWSIFYEIDEVDPSWSRIPYGRPLSGQAWHIRDALNRPTPVWTVGDLYISGIGLAQGYWGDDDKTRASFFTDPRTSTRLYRTGDRGRYLPDGNIEFLGRADTQVKIQGHRIELGEIETVLNGCALVKEAVVLARPVGAAATAGSLAGPGAKELVAFAVPANALPADAAAEQALIEQLRTALRQQLPAYMVPAAWGFLAQMPLSSNGKVDRLALGRLAVSARESDARRAEPVPPRSETERTLARLWQQVLKREAVGVHDDFFECGGQSIDAVRYVALVQEAFGKLLSLGDVWEHRTIEQQAALLDSDDDFAPRGNLARLGSAGQGRPHFLVHPAGGQCVGYYALARRLSRPCHGFTAHADEAARGELSSIEDIARRYVDQLKREQPNGPYSLVGWSSGGCIAFAMAHELERVGDRVERVTLIDCPAPLVHDAIAEPHMLRGFLEDLNLGIPTDELVDDQGHDLGARFARAIERVNARLGPVLDAASLQPVYEVFKSVVDAVRRYHPPRIAAPLLLLRATLGEVSEFAGHPQADRPDWGWSALTRAETTSKWVTGTHYSVLTEPGVDQIASALNEAPINGSAGVVHAVVVDAQPASA